MTAPSHSPREVETHESAWICCGCGAPWPNRKGSCTCPTQALFNRGLKGSAWKWSEEEIDWKARAQAAEEALALARTGLTKALAFIDDEAEMRTAAGSEMSDYEREPRELVDELRAILQDPPNAR